MKVTRHNVVTFHKSYTLILLYLWLLLFIVSQSTKDDTSLFSGTENDHSSMLPQEAVELFAIPHTSDSIGTLEKANDDGYEMETVTLGGTNGRGQWSSIIDLPLIPVAAANLPNGNILLWSAYDRYDFGGNRGKTYTSIFDPLNNRTSLTLVNNTKHDMFCPGTTNLVDGRVLVNGGSSSAKTSIYDPNSDTWTSDADMNIRRGYQANTILPDGSVLTIGGSWSGGKGGKHAEVWNDGSGWSLLRGIPVDPIVDGITDPSGIFAEDNHAWLWAAPNGKVFHAGPSTYMHWLDTSGDGSHVRAGTRGNDTSSMCGTCVMYDVGKLLKVGGSESYQALTKASDASYTIDINSDTPVVNKTDSLNRSRTMHNSVVLPNGQVLVIGGIKVAKNFRDDNSRLVAELWTPQTGQWRDVAAMQISRAYHSTALLLLDGRVFAGGGGQCGDCKVNHPNCEIYSPPYLFKGNSPATRPVIETAPSAAKYGSIIDVQTDSSVVSFSIIRLSSVTHSTNNDQRRIPLELTIAGRNNYNLTIPNNSGIVPPGYYMLFALNSAGTPSVAKTIHIMDDLPQEPARGTASSDNTYRYVQLVAESEVNSKPWASAAEFHVIDRAGNDLRRNGWNISTDSEETERENGRVGNAIDGNQGTFWHTQRHAAAPTHPHRIIIDMGQNESVGGFRYLPRQTGPTHGTIADYKFFVSNDGVNWGDPVAQGTMANNRSEKRVILDSSLQRYLRLRTR